MPVLYQVPYEWSIFTVHRSTELQAIIPRSRDCCYLWSRPIAQQKAQVVRAAYYYRYADLTPRTAAATVHWKTTTCNPLEQACTSTNSQTWISTCVPKRTCPILSPLELFKLEAETFNSNKKRERKHEVIKLVFYTGTSMANRLDGVRKMHGS